MGSALVLAGESAAVLDRLQDVRAAFTAAEHARAGRFRSPAARDDYVAAHLLVRSCAARVAGVPPTSLTLRHLCPGCGGSDHGRPYVPELPGISVSLSHTRGHVAAVAGEGDVAVDAEAVRPGAPSAAVCRQALTAAEAAAVVADTRPGVAFALRWTYKECIVKLGEASLGTLHHIETPSGLFPADIPVQHAGRWVLQWGADQGTVCGTALTSGIPALENLNTCNMPTLRRC
ncbi:4'-phosphopantetheinyl transferase family protein [Streptoverticillium reticulum]|uniref:4'-phosphopantetheinyl transferase family protein n=1 Tax=Streptomyces TaxID=1883 RepID=UPI003679EFBB